MAASRILRSNFGTVEVLKTLEPRYRPRASSSCCSGRRAAASPRCSTASPACSTSPTGQIFIKGKNVTWEEPKDRGIGMVFQSYALYPQMTVEGNLSFGLKNAGLPSDEIAKRIARAAEILQIEPLLKRKPAAALRRPAPARRHRPGAGARRRVFLFDEPLSNLDAKLRSELRVEIKRLHQQLGNTMIYVTHDQIEALTLADRIAVMKGGTSSSSTIR